MPLVGVLALQGGFQAHEQMLRALGAHTRELRTVADLDRLDGLVLPGGESTAITLGIAREGLAEPLRELVMRGTPVLGSCAGLIMLDRDHLALMDMRAERNAFGRQLQSFETDLEVRGLAGGPLRAVFIRAPWIAEHGPDVEVLAEVDRHPVAARQDAILAVAFHAELTRDDRIHRLFLEHVTRAARSPELPRSS
jgi:5'-phosphate synthase pdxT subunit